MTLLTACTSTTKIKNSWSNSEYKSMHYSDVLIIGIHNDFSKRNDYENKLAEKLRAQGINAVAASSIKLLAQERDREQIITYIKDNNFDSVLVTKYQALSLEEIYHSGYKEYQVIGYRGYFRPYYRAAVIEIDHPTYTENRTKVYLEANLFEVSEGSIVWRAVTESVNPQQNLIIDDVINKLSSRIKQDQVFSK